MAIDTRDKRAACVGIDKAYSRILPAPDGAVSQADRQMVGYKYPGILFTTGAAGAGWGMLLSQYRNRLVITGIR